MQALLNSSAYELEQAATQQRNQHDERLGKPMFPPRVTAAEPSLADTQSDISAAALAIQVVARDACAGDAATSGSLSQKFLEECRNHLQVSPIGDANTPCEWEEDSPDYHHFAGDKICRVGKRASKNLGGFCWSLGAFQAAFVR
eukprot:1635769-Amphidinium_carterae.1